MHKNHFTYSYNSIIILLKADHICEMLFFFSTKIFVLNFTELNSNLADKADVGIIWGNKSCNDLGFGIFLANNAADSPTKYLWHMIISAAVSGTGIQIGIPLINGVELYVRACSAGTWMAWRKVN